MVAANQPSALGRDPKCAVTSNHQIENVIFGECGRVLAIEQDQPHTIKTKQTPGCSNPEITVFGLGKCLYRLFRKAVLHLPDAIGVGRRGGIEGSSGNRHHEEAEKCSRG